jgi:hypothetical protein
LVAVSGPDVALGGIVEVDVVVDVSDDMPVEGFCGDVATPARAALVLPGVPGVVATSAVVCGRIGCNVRVPAVACDDDVSASVSDVVAHAAPAMPNTEIATAVTNFVLGAFITGLLRRDGGAGRRTARTHARTLPFVSG